MSKITALVISYNEINYIKRAVESVISQITDNIEIEILIGDDGSCDGSHEVICQIEDEYSTDKISIRHFFMCRDEDPDVIIPSIRVSNLIKIMLSAATGDYCTILSADDFFCDNTKFITAMTFLDNHSDYFSYVTGFRYNKKVNIPDSYSSFMFWAHPDYFHISCFVFRRIDPSLLLERYCDDTGMLYSILKQGKYKSDNKITFEYFHRDDSITNSSSRCELLINEAMIIQDILNDRNLDFGFRFATKSREFWAVKELYACRNLLKDKRFLRYLLNCSQYKNDIVGRLADCSVIRNRLWFILFFSGMAFAHYYIAVIWRLEKLFRKNR